MSIDQNVDEIAALIDGRVVGDGATRITGLSTIRGAAPGDLTFLDDARYQEHLAGTQAAAVLVRPGQETASQILIEVEEPYEAFGKLYQQFLAVEHRQPEGVHPSAVVSDEAVLGENVAIGPNVVLDGEVTLGDGAIVHAGTYLAHQSTVGAGSIIHANVCIREGTVIGARCIVHSGCVLGSDGFGFQPTPQGLEKIPQLGRVVIGDDVEIGANTSIDRATFGETRIGTGTKIDNLVQIGHNVEIGQHCIICGTSGIAGSAIIGNGVVIAAGAGINGHIEIGDGARIGAFTGVAKSVKAGADVFGFPAMELNEAKRYYSALRYVPDRLRTLRKLEDRVRTLEEELHGKAEDDRE